MARVIKELNIQVVRYAYILFILFAVIMMNCTVDPCMEKDFPGPKELLFDVDGQMLIVNSCSEDLTYLYDSQDFRLKFRKKSCFGEIESMYAHNFRTDSVGSMKKLPDVPVEFSILNPDDVIEWDMFFISANGEEFALGNGETTYDDWEMADGNLLANGFILVVYRIEDSGKFDWHIASISMSFK